MIFYIMLFCIVAALLLRTCKIVYDIVKILPKEEPIDIGALKRVSFSEPDPAPKYNRKQSIKARSGKRRYNKIVNNVNNTNNVKR